jgi:hypothetical protein
LRDQRGANARAGVGRRRKRRRRGRQRLHFILLALFLVGLVLILSLTVFFKIEAVYVLGTDKYDPELIAADSGILIGDNLLRIDREDVAARIMEKYPYIASVEVQRRFPPAVEITLTQSVPDGAVRIGDEVALITAEGKVLERGKILIPESVPLVIGVTVDGPGEPEEGEAEEDAPIVRTEPGGYLPETESEKLGMLRNLLTAIEETGFTSITNVDLSDRLNIQIIFENRVLLKLGVEADLAYKLQYVRGVLETLAKEEPGQDTRGTLDVSEVGEVDKGALWSPRFGEEEYYEPAVDAIGVPEEEASDASDTGGDSVSDAEEGEISEDSGENGANGA